ncbi:acylneuraminate cytidylyltransferase (plasmid) [Azospirillum thermophilum]|uniref:Acylneuraminate cytidylyltransferase n=2 Tax=Azospirillum thermophilum TaxID=2202148 RepID=A0A2S2D0M9_9PROT|nr:acylneuraminate cytidylyltransferase [Azospirillum thermophilum]
MPDDPLRPLAAGLALPAHAIRQALAAGCDDAIVVTDDPGVAALARAHGAKSVRWPGDRSLAPIVPDAVAVLLDPVTPLRRPDEIRAAVALLHASDADAVVGAVRRRLPGWLGGTGSGLLEETGALAVLRDLRAVRPDGRPAGRCIPFEMAAPSALRADTAEGRAAVEALITRPPYALPAVLPQRPALIVFDFDGVMTDNRVTVGEDGSEMVRCSRGDGLGIDRLRKAGVPMLVLSTERNPVVAARCRKLRMECHQGVDDKGTYLAALLAGRKIDPADVAYVGNDVNDLDCLRLVGLPVVVADAHPDVLPYARLVLPRPGGDGAVRALADHLLREMAVS